MATYNLTSSGATTTITSDDDNKMLCFPTDALCFKCNDKGDSVEVRLKATRRNILSIKASDFQVNGIAHETPTETLEAIRALSE